MYLLHINLWSFPKLVEVGLSSNKEREQKGAHHYQSLFTISFLRNILKERSSKRRTKLKTLKSSRSVVPEFNEGEELEQHYISWIFLLFLFPRVFELSSLSDAKTKLQAPSINNRLWQQVHQTPYKLMGPIRCAPRLIPNPAESCCCISIRRRNEEGWSSNRRHFRSNIQRDLYRPSSLIEWVNRFPIFWFGFQRCSKNKQNLKTDHLTTAVENHIMNLMTKLRGNQWLRELHPS